MKSAGSIRQLDPSVVSRIAAGEAISCPSNAIKELIENSIDANSTWITIEIERGGYDLIRIIDDGSGISYNDLPIACKAHTTSKISDFSDLQNIGTFGFRGEALHSISMVTHLKIITKTDNDERASVANYFEGELSGQIGFIAAPKGTTIEARNLFYNYTMRLQGINPNAEAKKITDIISKYSVIYPHIGFVVRSNKKETLMTYGKTSSSETVLKLLYGFNDVNFFRCNFNINNGYYIELFLSEPNTKVKKKTNALFINRRLVKNDLLIKGIEEAYTKNNIFGTGIGSLQFCFIVMTVPPNTIDVNIHPKKEKVKFLNEKETINEICEKVKEIVNERSQRSSQGSKTNLIYDTFYKKANKTNNNGKTQTIIQAFSSDVNHNDLQTIDEVNDTKDAVIASQADVKNDTFSTKNYDNDSSFFGLDLKSNPIVSHNSSRVPTLTSTTGTSSLVSTSDFSLNQKKIETMKNLMEIEDIDGDGNVAAASIVSSLPTVSNSSMSSSPVRSSLFAAFNPPPKAALSQVPRPKESSKKKQAVLVQSQQPVSKPSQFHFLSDNELDDFNDSDFITAPAKSIKPTNVTKKQDGTINIKAASTNNSSVFSTPLAKRQETMTTAPTSNSSLLSAESTKMQDKTESVAAAAISATEEPIERSQQHQSPVSTPIKKVANNESSPISSFSFADFITSNTNNGSNSPNEASPKKASYSLLDLIGSQDKNDAIPDLPSFAPDIQKKAIESIEKKNSSPPKSKGGGGGRQQKNSRASVFDDLKYDPTNSSQGPILGPSSSSPGRRRGKSSSTVAKEDSSMKKLEDLFSNVGDNMKRKFRVVKLLSIIGLRKKREEEADLQLKQLFKSNKLEFVGFIGTTSVIFTAPTETAITNNIDNDDGIVSLNNYNKVLYIFNLFALMKDLLIHKFLELFSNLPTFNVEMTFDDITACKNDSINQFFANEEMKNEAKKCLEEKKDMLLEYFSIFYKNGSIKAMPDVIRGYRPSLSSFPLFIQKLISVIDWEDETNCFEGLIDQLASLYSILPDDDNKDNQKVANNLLLQFKTAVLPELSDEGYWPNASLRGNGSFVTVPVPSLYV